MKMEHPWNGKQPGGGEGPSVDTIICRRREGEKEEREEDEDKKGMQEEEGRKNRIKNKRRREVKEEGITEGVEI